MVKGTRLLMYKKLGISDTNSAEQKYKTDPNFESQVNNTYRDSLDQRIPSNITGKQREYMIAKGWYTGNPNYPDNKVPHPEAGNRLTAGQYASRAVKQTGGDNEEQGEVPTAVTENEQNEGLNNQNYSHMVFPTQGVNTFRGLNNGQGVIIHDEKGKQRVLRGKHEKTKMNGRVDELTAKH